MLRKTKIICTLGPAVDNPDMIRALIRGGMNAARFNFSHGSHPEHLARLNMLKSVRDTMSRPVATILDTKGPEIRIKAFQTKTVELSAGDIFTLTTDETVGDNTRVSVTYPALHAELEVGQQVLIDDGLIAIRVEEICDHKIRCRVENGGVLSANKSINIPGVELDGLGGKALDADLGALGIHDDRHVAAGFGAGRAQILQRLQMTFMAAVGEVQAYNVHACIRHFSDCFLGGTSRA